MPCVCSANNPPPCLVCALSGDAPGRCPYVVCRYAASSASKACVPAGTFCCGLKEWTSAAADDTLVHENCSSIRTSWSSNSGLSKTKGIRVRHEMAPAELTRTSRNPPVAATMHLAEGLRQWKTCMCAPLMNARSTHWSLVKHQATRHQPNYNTLPGMLLYMPPGGPVKSATPLAIRHGGQSIGAPLHAPLNYPQLPLP